VKCVKPCDLRDAPAPPVPRPAPPGELTERQRDFLDAVLARLAADGIPPTLQDLADWTGMVKSGAASTVAVLRKKGWLLRSRESYRDLRLSPAALRRLRSVRPEGGRVVVSLWEPAAVLSPCQARRLAADLMAASDAAESPAP
jgi:SOS-response transcriptional repressor LexA